MGGKVVPLSTKLDNAIAKYGDQFIRRNGDSIECSLCNEDIFKSYFSEASVETLVLQHVKAAEHRNSITNGGMAQVFNQQEGADDNEVTIPGQSRESSSPAKNMKQSASESVIHRLVEPSPDVYASVITQRERSLQKLLQEERQRSEQRKLNYNSLKDEHLRLQKDFLNLQSEIKVILEDTKMMKSRKMNEIESLKKMIADKEASVETLKLELNERDPIKLREKVMNELSEPIRRLEKEKEQNEREKERLNHEINMLASKIEHQDKEITDAIEKVKLTYEVSINLLKREKEELKVKIHELSQTPDNVKMNAMSDENSRLKYKLNKMKETLSDSEESFKKVQFRLEQLISDYEKSNTDHAMEISRYKMKFDAMNEKYDKCNQQLVDAKRRIAALIEDITAISKDNTKIRKDKEDTEKRFVEEKEKLKKTLAKESKEHEKELIRIKESSKLNQGVIRDLMSEKEVLLDRVSQLQSQLISQTQRLQSTEARLVNHLSSSPRVSFAPTAAATTTTESDTQPTNHQMTTSATSAGLTNPVKELDKLNQVANQVTNQSSSASNQKVFYCSHQDHHDAANPSNQVKCSFPHSHSYPNSFLHHDPADDDHYYCYRQNSNHSDHSKRHDVKEATLKSSRMRGCHHNHNHNARNHHHHHHEHHVPYHDAHLQEMKKREGMMSIGNNRSRRSNSCSHALDRAIDEEKRGRKLEKDREGRELISNSLNRTTKHCQHQRRRLTSN